MVNTTHFDSSGLKLSLSICAIFLLVIFLATQESNADISAVWVCNDGEKIEQNDLDNPNMTGNSAWNGTQAKIFGRRNEILAFQVIVAAGGQSINSLTATLSGLKERGGSSRIVYTPPAKDPTVYTGRPIQIYSVNYMNVARRTSAEWFYPLEDSHPALPTDPVGLKPVQLIPENAARGKGGFPLRVLPELGYCPLS